MARGIYVGVPSSYTPVEYIESTGTQYIDTGFYPSSSSRVELDYQLTGATTSFNTTNILRASNGADIPSFSCGCAGGGGNANNARFCFGSNYSYYVDFTGLNNTNRHTVKVDCVNSNIVVDNTSTYNVTRSTFTCISTMSLPSQGTALKIYFCKIYDNGALVRDFTPAVDQDNVACLYEQVEGKFYYNKGTGSFVAGNTTGSPVLVEDVARKIAEAYVGVNGVARKIKKGYVGVNGVSRRFYWLLPHDYISSGATGIVRSYVGMNYNAALTTNYIVLAGGKLVNSSSMNNSYAEALNKSGVIMTIDKITARMELGSMTLNGNAVFVAGQTTTSGSSISNYVEAYNDSLVKSTLSSLSSTCSSLYCASNSVHGLRLGGNAYSSVRNTVDIYDNNLVKTSGTSLTVGRKNNGVACVGEYILTACGSTSGSGSGGTIKSVEAYDNNNVKTSASDVSEAANFKRGVSTSKYAIFYGGTLSSENGVSTKNFTYYNSSLVKSEMVFDYSSYNGIGLQVDDIIMIASGDTRTTAGGSITYNNRMLFYNEDLIKIDEVFGAGNSSWNQNRYFKLGDRIYYTDYGVAVGYFKY